MLAVMVIRHAALRQSIDQPLNWGCSRLHAAMDQDHSRSPPMIPNRGCCLPSFAVLLDFWPFPRLPHHDLFRVGERAARAPASATARVIRAGRVVVGRHLMQR